MEVILFLALFGLTIVEPFGSARSITNCKFHEDGWTLMEMEYKIFANRSTHQEAQEKCSDWGIGHLNSGLAEIVNEQVQECLQLILQSENRQWQYQDESIYLRTLFIGGSDMETESVWKWGNHEVISLHKQGKFENWAASEPNNFNNEEDCMGVLHSDIGEGFTKGTWLDLSCHERLPYICQRKSKTLVPVVSPYKAVKKISSGWCSGPGQSAINLDPGDRKCKIGSSEQVGKIWRWGSTASVNWKIQNMNNGEYVKIFFDPPRKVFTIFEDDRNRKYFVEYAHLKWGTGPDFGSEHMVQNRKRNMEFQIFHYLDGQPKRQAVAFFLSNFDDIPTDNHHWSFLFNSLASVQNTAEARTMKNPPANFFMSMLGYGEVNPRLTLRIAIRYEGSMTVPPGEGSLIEPCGVIWTVYTVPIKVSNEQVNMLRAYVTPYPNRKGVRAIQSSDGVEQCYFT